METTWDLDWRSYPAACLASVGLILAARGGIVMVRAFLLPLDRADKNLLTVRAMRAFLQGASLAATAVGWWFHWPAMFWAGLIIGFEETLETSIAAWALKQEYGSHESTSAPAEPGDDAVHDALPPPQRYPEHHFSAG